MTGATGHRGAPPVAHVEVEREAALVFLVLFVPGYLYLAGYRLGRAVTEHREGIATVAKVIAISAVIAVIAWKLGGRDLYGDARTGTALTSDEGDTWRFVIALLVIPGLLGFVAGELVDEAAHRISEAQDRRRDAQADGVPRRGFKARLWDEALEVMSARLLPDGPTTWDRAWRHLRRTQDYVYVRVTTKNGQEIVGTMTDRSRIALSPQPQPRPLRIHRGIQLVELVDDQQVDGRKVVEIEFEHALLGHHVDVARRPRLPGMRDDLETVAEAPGPR